MFFLALFLIPLFSCSREIMPKGVEFDVEKFNKQKESWSSLGIKKYSFTYSFDGYMPEYIVGNTAVDNEICIVDVNYTDGSESKIKYDSKYYIESIDKVFEILNLEYEQALEDVNEKLYDAVIFKCNYNNTYAYPEYISILRVNESDNKKNKNGILVGSANVLTFRVKYFNN